MIEQLPPLANLVRQLQQIPYLASKNVYRVLNHILHMTPAQVEQLCQALRLAKENVVACSRCYVWQVRDAACMFCSHPKRDQSLICVVETWQELLSIERTGGYYGVYHILGGVLSPLDGIGPEDLHVQPLIQRIDDTVKEVILATNQTPEGEATAMLLAQKLKKYPIKISCLARGIPIGSCLEFMDKMTVYKALSERRPF